MILFDLLKSKDPYVEEQIKDYPGLYDVYKNGLVRDLPQRQTKYSAAYDLALPYSELIKAHSSCYLNFGYHLQKSIFDSAYLLPRSSLAKKKGLILISSATIVAEEEDLIVKVQNISNEDVIISAGERIFQLLLLDHLKSRTYYNNFERVSSYNFNFPSLVDYKDGKDFELDKFYFQALDYVELPPNSLSFIKTGIKSKFKNSEVLLLHNAISSPNIILANNIGVVDADYYNNESNEGEIGFIYYNKGYLPYIVKKGDVLGFGTIETYLKLEGDKVNGERTGGFGST